MQSSKSTASSNQRLIRIVGGLITVGLVVVAVVFAYIWFNGGSGQPSTTVSAPPVDASSASVFHIEGAASQVSFTLTEELMGTPTTVIGTTKDVAGDIAVDFANPANSKLGTLRISARTLATDNEFRNRAIRSQILQSSQDQYEFIEFAPTAISGLPASAKVGDTLNFKVTGDLKVREVTQPVTFDVTLTVTADTQIDGKASAQVTREQFGLQIPNAPGVANVSNEVKLEIAFVATKAA
jgi:polyisoprenoid-binding protein YceI